MRLSERVPSLPYVLPFAVFMLLLWLGPRLGMGPGAEATVRVGLLVGVLWLVSRPVLDLHLARPAASVAVGALVFAIWIAPDLLVPGWHHSPAFSNGVVGRFESSVPVDGRSDPLFLLMRAIRATLLVPIIEELFWRGWLPRWFERMDDFRKVPLGQYTPLAFWLTAILFASEHGSLWDVGLAAGVIYNEWMRRTRSLGDVMLAHGITNGLLSGYVLLTGRWEYW